MSDDIRLSTGFFTHHKTIKLERRFGLIGVKSLINLWMWTAQNRPTGILEGMTEEDLEIASAWPDVDRKLIPALVELHWLDIVDGVYHVHGWAENQPWIIGAGARKEKARKANAKRWGSEDVLPQASSEDTPRTPKRVSEESPSPFPSFPIPSNPQENINTVPPIGASEPEQTRESKRFVPPSLADVTEYLTAKNSPIDPETFHAFYEANGWVQGSGGKKIKSWKACATTWEKRHAKDNPSKPQDTRWHKYRAWASRYAEKRLTLHPGEKYDSPSEIDEAAKVVAEYIAPDAFTEELLGLGIDWLLQAPERCAYVPTLKNLGDFASPAWGSLAGWACNAVRGVKVTDSPFETGI